MTEFKERECIECGAPTTIRAKLRGPPGEKVFVCSECGEVFLNYEDRGDLENLSYHCPGCGVEFEDA